MKPVMLLYKSLYSSDLPLETISPEITWTMDNFHFDDLPNHKFEHRNNYSRANLIIDYSCNSISVYFVIIIFKNIYCFSCV